jgi:RNA recognition motif-containing protein
MATARPRQHAASVRPEGSIYVGNLPFSVTDEDLVRLFARYGEVGSATVITHRDSKKSRGFGFVDMPRGTAQTAITGLNGSTISGRRLKVRAARSQV